MRSKPPTTTLQTVLLRILRAFLVVVAMMAAVVTLVPLYAAYVFPWLTPARALRGIFEQPQAVRVVTSEQQGAFLVGNTVYVADGVVQGALTLRPNLVPTAAPHLRSLIAQKHLCDELLSKPEHELRYYHNFSGSPVPSPQPPHLQAFVVEHRPSQTYCFHYVQVPE